MSLDGIWIWSFFSQHFWDGTATNIRAIYVRWFDPPDLPGLAMSRGLIRAQSLREFLLEEVPPSVTYTMAQEKGGFKATVQASWNIGTKTPTETFLWLMVSSVSIKGSTLCFRLGAILFMTPKKHSQLLQVRWAAWSSSLPRRMAAKTRQERLQPLQLYGASMTCQPRCPKRHQPQTKRGWGGTSRSLRRTRKFAKYLRMRKWCRSWRPRAMPRLSWLASTILKQTYCFEFLEGKIDSWKQSTKSKACWVLCQSASGPKRPCTWIDDIWRKKGHSGQTQQIFGTTPQDIVPE